MLFSCETLSAAVGEARSERSLRPELYTTLLSALG